jgi:hypothetical protein
MGRFQELIAKSWAWLSSGFNPNRRTVDAIAAARFDTSGCAASDEPWRRPDAQLICKELPP